MIQSVSRIFWIASLVFPAVYPCATFGDESLPARIQPLVLYTGQHDNASDKPAIVFSRVIDAGPEVPWVRVLFEGANLPAGSTIRVTALLDGESQTLDARQLTQWGNGSAFFNGSAVRIELSAGPKVSGAFARVGGVLAGQSGDVERAVCVGGQAWIFDNTDDRIRSFDPRVGRLILPQFLGTAFIIADGCAGADKLHLTNAHAHPFTLGHDLEPTAAAVLEFNVPLSSPNCAIVHPGVQDQFPVAHASIVTASNAGQGTDWGVFRCYPNSVGHTTFTHTPPGYTFSRAPAPLTFPHPARVTGFGHDSDEDFQDPSHGEKVCCCPTDPTLTCGDHTCTGIYDQIQQSAAGSLVDPDCPGPVLGFTVDSCHGNSGSPVIIDQPNAVGNPPNPADIIGSAVGILSGADCAMNGENGATPTTLAALQTAIGRQVNGGASGGGRYRGRYIHVTPGCALTDEVALRVSGDPANPALSCLGVGKGLTEVFVQADGTLGPTAIFQSSAVWRTVHVRGCELAPTITQDDVTIPSTYTIQRVKSGSPDVHLGTVTTALWGDVDHDADIDVDDITAILAAFSDIFEFASFYSCDIRGAGAACVPDGTIDVTDILAVLDAFAEIPYYATCPTPCPYPCGGTAPATGGGQRNVSAAGKPAALDLIITEASGENGPLVIVDVYLNGAPDLLRAYQIALDVTGGERGYFSLISLGIDTGLTTDFVFGQLPHHSAADLVGGRLVAALATGGVSVLNTSYLATFTLAPSADALGEFTVTVRRSDSLLRNPPLSPSNS